MPSITQSCLPRLRVLYASPSKARFGLAEEVFREFERPLATRRPQLIETRIGRLARLLHLETSLPRDGRGDVPPAILGERSALRREFDSALVRRLLQLGARHGEREMHQRLRPKGLFGPREALFETLHLDHDYKLFGLL